MRGFAHAYDYIKSCIYLVITRPTGSCIKPYLKKYFPKVTVCMAELSMNEASLFRDIFFSNTCYCNGIK